MTRLIARHFFRRAGGDDLPAAGAAFGAEVDDPVGGFDHVQIVLDDHHSIAVARQALHHF